MPNAKPIVCIAVDDEPPALKLIEQYIRAIPALELKGCCNNAVDALALLNETVVDLIFLDIQMPHILGTDFMRTLSNPPKVIFTTAFRKFAVEGFDLDAVDYLLKPISFQRFLKAVNKVLKLDLVPADHHINSPMPAVEPASDFIYLRADRKNIRINFEDIYFIESLKNYIKVVTKDRTIVAKYPISTLEITLPPSFIRIHRSFIVSRNKIASLTHDFIQIGKYELPVSRSYRQGVEKLLKVK